MIHFVFEDTANIAMLCFLLGVGFVSFIGVALAYIASYFLMEYFNERD